MRGSSSSNTSASSSASAWTAARISSPSRSRRPRPGRRPGPDAARQLRMRDTQPHRRHVPGERLDARPVEKRAGPDRAGEPARDKPAQEAPWARIDADNPVPALDTCDLDVVGANEPRTFDVDQLAVEHVFLQQHLLRTAFERLQVETCLVQDDPAQPDLADRLGGHEDRRPATDARTPVTGG